MERVIDSESKFIDFIEHEVSNKDVYTVAFTDIDFTDINLPFNAFDIYYRSCEFNNCKNVLHVASKFIDCVFDNCTFKTSNSSHIFLKCVFNAGCEIGPTIYENDGFIYTYECVFIDSNILFGILDYSRISYTNFKGCNISINTALKHTQLNDIYIENCKLYDSNFSHADCYNIFIDSDTIIENVVPSYIRNLCPDGEFIGYKKVRIPDHPRYIFREDDDSIIATLLIPADAKRLSSINGKCRCDKAKVLSLENLDGTPYNETYGISPIYFNKTIMYTPGEEVIADGFNENPLVECGNGIHFFMTKEEARRY